MFCPPIATLEPATAGTTALSEVSEGQRTISSRSCPLTSGRKALTYSSASAGVLYIFQFAAMSGLRIFALDLKGLLKPQQFILRRHFERRVSEGRMTVASTAPIR